jgi:hypothetical protein
VNSPVVGEVFSIFVDELIGKSPRGGLDGHPRVASVKEPVDGLLGSFKLLGYI